MADEASAADFASAAMIEYGLRKRVEREGLIL